MINPSDEDLADLVGARNCAWLKIIRIHRYTGPHKTQKSFEETHVGYGAETLSRESGLARTGGKQALLTRADHRSVDRIGFVSHNWVSPFLG